MVVVVFLLSTYVTIHSRIQYDTHPSTAECNVHVEFHIRVLQLKINIYGFPKNELALYPTLYIMKPFKVPYDAMKTMPT